MKKSIIIVMGFLLIQINSFAQDAAVTVVGNVIDADSGIPIPGVNVVQKGTSNGTMTNFDGQYTIEVPPDAILQFSYVGYHLMETEVEGRTEVEISLQPQTSALEEVMVIGYGTQKKKTVTGSVAQVDGDDLTEAPVSTVSEALVGKIPGVNTKQPDGRPGAGTNLQIRNMGTPLYVIDGVPQGELQFNNLNPGDIESISVLKDGSAAIYGVRASNGVVLVTTKSGNLNQENQINIHAYHGWQSFTRMPQPAIAADFVRASAEAEINQNGSTNWTPEEVAKWQEGTEEGYRGFDWSSYTRENVPKKYIQANASGGSEKTSYYFSLSHLDQEAVFEGYKFNRTNLQSNVSTNISERLKVGLRINGKIEKRNAPAVTNGPGDLYWQPLWGVFRNLPTETPYANNNPNYPNTTSRVTTNYATFEHLGWTQDMWRSVQTNFDVDYDLPVKGLEAKGVYSFFYNSRLNDVYEYAFDTYTYDATTDIYEATGGRSGRSRSRRNQHITNNVLRVMLNYDRDFGNHHVSAVMGGEAEERLDKNFNVISTPATNYIELINDVSELQNVQDNIFEEARAGFFFRANYNYKDKYLMELSGRYDGSWRFPPGNRWGFFPSASVGWRITEEDFLQNSRITDVLNDFKFRASYGKMGDDRVGVGAFAYMAGYNYGAGSAFLDGQLITGIAPRGMPVRTLSWIESSIANIGFDFRMWDGKLSGDMDAFYRKRTGLPGSRYDVLIPLEAALDLPPENLGADANMGVEGSLLHRNKLGELSYSVGVNATLARRKNLYTYKPRFGNSWNHYRTSNEDRWAGMQWGQQVIGRFQSEEQIANYPVDIDGRNNTTVLPGDFIYKDLNEDGLIDDLDERPIGYGHAELPYLMFGLNSNVSYKGIDFSVTLSGGALQSRARVQEMKIPFRAGFNSPDYLLNDRWHREDIFDPESSWVSGTYPALRRSQNAHNNMGSDFWFRNVKYLRIRNIQIGYTLPNEISSVVGIPKARFYLNGLNLFSFDNVKDIGLDPETDRANGLNYPPMKVINIGANITL